MKKRLFAFLLTVIVMTTTPAIPAFAEEEVVVSEQESEVFSYEHDPRLNSKAMADIIVDPDAVYGFSPNPDSTRLGSYASYDWSDPAVVEAARQERIAYLNQFNAMYDLWNQMKAAGKNTEEIARTVSALRNQIRLDAYKNDPEGLEKVKKSNLDTYGNENGPTADSLFAKYGSWETVLMKSFSSNSGMDACLGLYDVQYEHNVLAGSIKEDGTILYEVKDGDYLAKIALHYYGDASKWKAIYNANSSVIKNAQVIYEGQKLIIPIQ